MGGCVSCAPIWCWATRSRRVHPPARRAARWKAMPTACGVWTRRSRGWGSKVDMTRKQRRLVLIGGSLGVLALAAVLVLTALKDSIVFFNSPSDVVEKNILPGSRIRLGGLV